MSFLRKIRRPWMIAVEDIRTGEWVPAEYRYTYRGAVSRCRRMNGAMAGSGYRAFGIRRVL